jgi:hypothetical protein
MVTPEPTARAVCPAGSGNTFLLIMFLVEAFDREEGTVGN